MVCGTDCHLHDHHQVVRMEGKARGTSRAWRSYIVTLTRLRHNHHDHSDDHHIHDGVHYQNVYEKEWDDAMILTMAKYSSLN